MKLKRRLTSYHETLIAVRVAQAFADTVEYCIERGEGRAAPTESLINEKHKCLSWMYKHNLDEYDMDYVTVSRPAYERIKKQAKRHAKHLIEKMFQEKKYSLAQIMSATTKKAA